jgi:ribosomal protein S18 acetylase RimI-like enzyme
VRVTLETARDNTSAQRLYEALGYERDAAFFRYHWRIA